jgi:hypothetical protein
MDCNYYIDKDLDIYDYNNTIFSYINLPLKNGYYWFTSMLDEDDDGYDEEHTKYIENLLEQNMKPILIYSNNSFNKLSFEKKYKEIIEDEIILFNKTWNDISNVIKIEHRYGRD